MELAMENEFPVLFDPARQGYWNYFFVGPLVSHRDAIPYLAPQEGISTPLSNESLFAITLDVLLAELSKTVRQGNTDPCMRTDKIVLSYNSSSGEQFQREMILTLYCSYADAHRDHKNAEFDEPWDSFRASIFLSWKEV